MEDLLKYWVKISCVDTGITLVLVMEEEQIPILERLFGFLTMPEVILEE